MFCGNPPASAGEKALRFAAELGDFLDTDKNVDDSQAQDGSLEKGVGDYRSKFGVEIEDVVVVPDGCPWEEEEKDTDFERIQYIENAPNPGDAGPPTRPAAAL